MFISELALMSAQNGILGDYKKKKMEEILFLYLVCNVRCWSVDLSVFIFLVFSPVGFLFG